MPFTAGPKTYASGSGDHLIDVHDGLKYLEARGLLRLVKKIGFNGFVAKDQKYSWDEVELAGKSETVTIDNVATALTVADSGIYQINQILKIEDERVRITALTDGTTLEIVRGYGDTSAAAHTAKVAYNLGAANPENSDAPEGAEDNASRLYNYIQIFDKGLELSKTEIMTRHSEGNPYTGQLKRRYIELMRELANSLLFGNRDLVSGVAVTGGLEEYITTNVTDASAAELSNALIDAELEAILLAGGDPDTIVVHPRQKLMLDAIDVNRVRTTLGNKTGGNPNIMKWQSGIMDKDLDIIVDHSVPSDKLYILDTSLIQGGYQAGNGESGRLQVVDATTPGQDGKKTRIIGHLGWKVGNEKAMARLDNLALVAA